MDEETIRIGPEDIEISGGATSEMSSTLVIRPVDIETSALNPPLALSHVGTAHCPICGEALTTQPVVHCRKCKTPYHQDCWNNVGQCGVLGCNGRRAALGMPDDVPVIEQPSVVINPPRFDAGSKVTQVLSNITGSDWETFFRHRGKFLFLGFGDTMILLYYYYAFSTGEGVAVALGLAFLWGVVAFFKWPGPMGCLFYVIRGAGLIGAILTIPILGVIGPAIHLLECVVRFVRGY